MVEMHLDPDSATLTCCLGSTFSDLGPGLRIFRLTKAANLLMTETHHLEVSQDR